MDRVAAFIILPRPFFGSSQELRLGFGALELQGDFAVTLIRCALDNLSRTLKCSGCVGVCLVGVLVEEMLEELVAPLVDGRTRGKFIAEDSRRGSLTAFDDAGD